MTTGDLLALFGTFAASAALTAGVLRWHARPARLFRRAIRQAIDGGRVTVGEDHSVRVTRDERHVVIPAATVLRYVDADDERRAAELNHTLAEVRRALDREPLGDQVSALWNELVPVPLPPVRTEALEGMARFAMPISEGLEVGFVVASPGNGRWMTRSDRQSLGLSDAALLDGSLARLRRTTDGAVILREGSEGREVYLVREGDELDAARLLLSDLWQRVARHCGRPLVLCAPTRDRIYAAPIDQPASIDRMVQHAIEDWDTRPHGLTPTLWTYEKGRLEPWTRHA